MQENTVFTITEISTFKQKALVWANQFDTIACLDNNQYTEYCYSDTEFLLAIDTVDFIETNARNAFAQLKKFVDAKGEQQKHIFGFFGYDLKNEVEKLHSKNLDEVQLPDLFFFEPRYLLKIIGNKLHINRNYPEAFHIFDSIQNAKIVAESNPSITLANRESKESYLSKIQQIKNHIKEGDLYEMNYCTEFYANNNQFKPLPFFLQLNQKSKAPFSAFIKRKQHYILCASPERFIKKVGKKLISQPIKGTIHNSQDEQKNIALKAKLYHDPKERAENVMIVDLVRNDLTKSAETGTIKVEELFKIYEFATINQMISTVSAKIREDVHPVEAIKNAFPMGSMTGAPKVKAMQLIEQYEITKRGVYSGAIGYFTPNQDFDFNVVIRTLIYDEQSGYLSLHVGGAITHDSVPEKEYAEIKTKAATILQLLQKG